VSRHTVGDLVEIFDGKGFASLARVLEIDRERVRLVPVGEPLVEETTSYAVTLATAIPKGDRFDWLVEKATELGAERLVPLVTERSVVDPRNSKLDRLRRMIIEACKQCRRSRLMALESPIQWADWLKREREGLRLLAARDGLPWLQRPPGLSSGRVLLAVGPEGGFTADEEAQARAVGWHPIRLGANVLRVETAGIAGLAMILSAYGESAGDGMV
jgi:16S rRNA (uracil1498-N3)-methyltransferase